jgi:PAS domain S-box-containing protein
MSLDGRVTDWNDGAERLFGHPRSAAVGRELADLIIPNALRDQHRRALQRFCETGEAPILGVPLELFALRADRTVFPVELMVIRVPDSDPPLFSGEIRERAA